MSGSEATLERAIDEEVEAPGYGRGARILSIGIAPSHYEPGARDTGQAPTTGAEAGPRTEEHEVVHA